MGRKGVSKRKKAKEKSTPVTGSISALMDRKAENLSEQVSEKGKSSQKAKRSAKRTGM
jgi:hypothetical protein